MNRAASYQPRRGSPTALTVVLLMHGAAIGALALSKMEVISDRIPPTVVELINDQPPPPPQPPEPKPQIEPQHTSVIDLPPPILQVPMPRPPIDTAPIPQPARIEFTPPGISDVPPPPPPPPPPAAVRKVEPARARANLASYVSDADYPAAAIRAEDQGTTRFRLTVSPSGRVTDCAVTSSSGSPALDAATCRLMKQRARFTPARDSSGNATGDTVTNAIRWVLPEG